MTSKRCFFKLMREDLRHKIWVFVLSVLGNMLAIPVCYLISTGQGGRRMGATVRSLTVQVQSVAEFFNYSVMISGGVIAVCGALIVGLSGFRYVFHRNMVDTYHSIPVRRRTLFLANWLDGFVIWFVPFLVSLGLTLPLGLARLAGLKDKLGGLVMNEEERLIVSAWPTGGDLIVGTLISLLGLTVAFLLVYHLALLAVMLCGNILNAMVTTASLGVGVITVYVLFTVFCGEYFDTFVGEAVTGYEGAAYASPLVSAIMLLYRRITAFDMAAGNEIFFWGACVLNLIIALALGGFAFLAYLKRPSELAEQGLKCRPVRFPMQIMVSLAAGMGGWLLFYAIGDGARLIWGIFGAVLAGGVSFCVMDIIFHMDFKAFSAHKLLLGLTVAAEIFLGLLFYFDWIGYDSYLPDREAIAEVAIFDNIYCNKYDRFYDIRDEKHPLNKVHIGNSDAVYAFLESATASDSTEEDRFYGTEQILTKVTLKSGRSYYRYYRISRENRETACALLSSPEYLNVNLRIGPDERRFTGINLYQGDTSREIRMDTPESGQLAEALCEAYNRDLEEAPEDFIHREGRMFSSIVLNDENNSSQRYIEVYEGMKHTVEALQQHGYAEFAEPLEAELIDEIQLSLGYRYADGGENWDPVEAARDLYGVWQEDSAENPAENPEGEAGNLQAYGDASAVYQDIVQEEYILHITEEAEIRELLELISYDTGRRNGGAFRLNPVDQVTIVIKEEQKKVIYANIPYGALPEKYIMRFGNL